jgi:hypothetical protein
MAWPGRNVNPGTRKPGWGLVIRTKLALVTFALPIRQSLPRKAHAWTQIALKKSTYFAILLLSIALQPQHILKVIYIILKI